MLIQSFGHDNILVLRLAGRLDAMSAGECEKAVDDALAKGSPLLLMDLEALEYISSAGLRVILKAAKALYGSGRLALARPQEGVREVLEMTGFGEIIPIHDTLEGALNELHEPV